MANVFISSTYSDLILHRRAVIDALIKRNHHPVAMEYFSSQPGDATEASIDELRKADIFVGIYGFRYGYCPDNDKSVTEQEYDAAIALQIPVLIFIIDPMYDDPKLKDHQETKVKQSRLDALKKRLEAKHVRERFTTPDNLALSVVTAIDNYLQKNASRPDKSALPPTIHVQGGDQSRNIGSIGSISGDFNMGDTHTHNRNKDEQ